MVRGAGAALDGSTARREGKAPAAHHACTYSRCSHSPGARRAAIRFAIWSGASTGPSPTPPWRASFFSNVTSEPRRTRPSATATGLASPPRSLRWTRRTPSPPRARFSPRCSSANAASIKPSASSPGGSELFGWHALGKFGGRAPEGEVAAMMAIEVGLYVWSPGRDKPNADIFSSRRDRSQRGDKLRSRSRQAGRFATSSCHNALTSHSASADLSDH